MDILDIVRNRRSVRAYDSRPIAPESYERLRGVLRYAPSACNIQPWQFIFVEEPALRKRLAGASCGQMWMAEAPLVVVACGFPDQAYKKMGGYGNSIDVDLAIALDHLSLMATAEGLGTCWIGAFDEQAVKGLLNIPDQVKVVALMPVGYPLSDDLIRPIDELKRKKPGELFSTDYFKVL